MQVEHNSDEQRFEVILGDQLALIDYVLRDGRIVFTHTEVPPDYEGQGIASKMAKAAMEYAKEQGLKVSAFCSYIDVYLQRHPEYQDLLP